MAARKSKASKEVAKARRMITGGQMTDAERRRLSKRKKKKK